MKAWLKALILTAAAAAMTLAARAQQQPVLTVEINAIIVGGVNLPPNESSAPMLTTIGISASAIGTHLVDSYTYTFYVNGIGIGKTQSPVPPGTDAVVLWTPPQPGSYFFTVTATDGSNTATSLPVRFFATGTVVNSPVSGTLVPAGSSVVLKADATVGGGFVREIQFFDNGTKIGSPDKTYPYSLIYTPPGTSGSAHSITAQATDNNGGILAMSAPVALTTVNSITPLPNCTISYPSDQSSILIPGSSDNISVQVNASSSTGFITKTELYIDGVLFGTVNSFPYTFSWHPTVIGNYTLTALAYDDKNNVIASPTNNVLIAAPLTVSMTSPQSGGTVTGGSPTQLRAVATDTNTDASGNPLQITSVQFFVDGTFVGQATTPSSSNTYTVTATLTPKVDENGNPKASIISALATDSAGISGVSPGVSVTVTSGGSGGGVVIGEPPTVAVTWPVAGTQVAVNRALVVTAGANDTDGNIASVQFFANNTSLGSTTTYPYSATWTPTSLGSYALTAKAIDSDGNAVTSSIVRVTVIDPSPTPPTVQIASPTNGATVQVSATQKIRADASDAVSVKSVEFFVDGVSLGAADTAYPFEASWTPATPGLYTLTARAVNASGNQTLSAPALVMAASTPSDSVYTGTYLDLGTGETGNFAVAAATGKTAVFIGYSTTTAAKKAYLYPNLTVDTSGSFSSLSPTGGTLISGTASATGVSGTFDTGRLTFIGVDTKYFPSGSALPTGYFSGKLTDRASSSLAAIVGADGSIMLHVADGTFADAGSGKLDGTGAFTVTSVQGNRFTGKVDPATRLLTGTLSGSSGGGFTGAPVSLGISNDKVTGAAAEVGSNRSLNGRTYDQVLLRGVSATVTADPGQVTRISYVDLSNDIVQVEFSGAGRLSLTLDNPSGPATAVNYNQPGIAYMKGHANIVITDADETSNVSVFTVGKFTAVDQALFKSGVAYDGIADIGYIAILSATGKFGGVRTANANYVAAQGMAGLCAPGVQFAGPVYIHNINASDSATPVLLLGSAADVRITGGDLWQANDRAVQVSGLSQLKFVDGMTSQGAVLSAQMDRSRLDENGRDVTMQLVVNPTP